MENSEKTASAASQVMTGTHDEAVTLKHIKMQPTKIESPVAQWLEHPTRSRRVVGSNPIWGSDFFRVLHTFNLSCVCCFIFNILTLEVGWLHLDML